MSEPAEEARWGSFKNIFATHLADTNPNTTAEAPPTTGKKYGFDIVAKAPMKSAKALPKHTPGNREGRRTPSDMPTNPLFIART